MRSVQQNRHECYEPNMSTSAILDFPNVTLYIVKWNVPFANNAYCGLTTFRTFPTVATPSTCSHLAWFEFKMSSDSDREELFKILTACTTVTKDNVLEFSRGLEKKYANEKQFFRTLPLRGNPWPRWFGRQTKCNAGKFSLLIIIINGLIILKIALK